MNSYSDLSVIIPTKYNLNDVCMIDTQYASAVGTAGTIIGTIPGGITSIEKSEIDNENPSEFLLNQNYPNPFNPSTTIHYKIPLLGEDERGGLVTLKIYDILGREIETLVNEQEEPGTYEVTWYASDQPSGVYFYRLTAGNYSETKKMILLR